MNQPIVEMAKDLVMALIEANRIAPEDMTQELAKTHANLVHLKAQEDGIDKGQNHVGASSIEPVNWLKSIKKHSIECLSSVKSRLNPLRSLAMSSPSNCDGR